MNYPQPYTKKPVQIYAIQWIGTNLDAVLAFTGPYAKKNADTDELTIYTLEDGIQGQAQHVATIGDYVIRGVKGEFYFCKPDIFDATYDFSILMKK